MAAAAAAALAVGSVPRQSCMKGASKKNFPAASAEFVAQFYKCLDLDTEKHFLLEQKLDSLQHIEPRLANIREEHCFYVASTRPLTSEERKQIFWLIEPSSLQSDQYATVSESESHLRALNRELQQQHQQQSLKPQTASTLIIEVGPRLNFCSPFSTNAVSILRTSCPATSVYRLERSSIYELTFNQALTQEQQSIVQQRLGERLHDRMVETIYPEPIKSFNSAGPQRAPIANGEPELQPCAPVDVLGRGEAALRELSLKLGLFFDDWDIQYYVKLFRDTIGRNPTVVECFDLAQSNSEHSRHWFFKGILSVRGRSRQPLEEGSSLIDLVASTQLKSSPNNVIKFEDNSSAIEGFAGVPILAPAKSSCCSQFGLKLASNVHKHIIFTAETHNFPTGVAPFPGAATGTGGRIRDVQATGRGAHVIAGTAGYSFGNLLLGDEHELDWENPHELYPNDLAEPSRIAIEASNGASDYGNKFGEPIVAGFARSFGMRLTNNGRCSQPQQQQQQQQSPQLVGGRSQRWEYLKPIMFTGGIGAIDERYVKKRKPQTGMRVAKVGGPVYRIGIGGGAASSASKPTDQGDSHKDAGDQLNFNAVQRGDPEMEQKMNRVLRACIENASEPVANENKDDDYNPILSIHDQGAGGNGNVLKEIVEPLGATIDANKFTLGDTTVNILELWAAEYQESDAILLPKDQRAWDFLERVARREKCKIDLVGQVEDHGQIRLQNFADFDRANERPLPIDLKLDYVIGSMPRKRFDLDDYLPVVGAFLAPARLIETEEIPSSTQNNKRLNKYKMLLMKDIKVCKLPTKSQMMGNFEHLLMKVLKLPSVGSKRYLTTKVDRCVTGLVAGQQCLGPLHTPIGDYALVALSHFDRRGAVTSIGEQPIKGLVSPISNATMSVAEALTNMMFCVISSLSDVKCSANWMWAAKLPGEGAKLVDACSAMCQLMGELGIAVDGGKDSLSMSARVDPKRAKKLVQVADGNDTDEEDDFVETVKAPGTLVISAYAPVPDINCKVTPILRCKPKLSHLIYVNLAHPLKENFEYPKPEAEAPSGEVETAATPTPTPTPKATPKTAAPPADLVGPPTVPAPEPPPVVAETSPTRQPSNGTANGNGNGTANGNRFRLGGSAILQTLGQIGDEAPSIDHPRLLRDGFNLIQELIRQGTCTAGHDVSDGGLITCALEMAIASHCGIHLNIKAEKAFRGLSCAVNYEQVLGALFAEECSAIIEVEAENQAELDDILERFEAFNIQAQRIGFGSYENQRVTVRFEHELLLEYKNNHKIRDCWESTSKQLDMRQANKRLVEEEYSTINAKPSKLDWRLTFDANATKLVVDFDKHYLTRQPRVAVLREEGINGDREMVASLALAGFQVFDLTISDLYAAVEDKRAPMANLNSFDGLVFPGGFSYADVFGSARGWAASLIFHPGLFGQLLDFRRRPNTFSLGVCNGCQLMSLLGFLDDLPEPRAGETPAPAQETTVRLEQNDSGRFECRFVTVKVEPTNNSLMLRDMEDSVLGVWVAHGEGKFKIEQSVETDNETLVALRYVNELNEPTMDYPMNPNGSDLAAAALCSRDGRHLAMMPHPERCTQLWQWPYLPEDWIEGPNKLHVSPWMQMFVNAYEFCKNFQDNDQ